MPPGSGPIGCCSITPGLSGDRLGGSRVSAPGIFLRVGFKVSLRLYLREYHAPQYRR